MTEVNLILRTHLAYFRQHPWLLVLFIVGLSLGSALLSAIAGLNQEAKNRHQTSSALTDAAVSHLIKPPIGQTYLDGQLWLALRAQGFTNAQPVLRGKLKLASGKTLYLQGVDSLVWLNNPAPTRTQQPAQHSTQQSTQHSPQQTGFSLDAIFIDSKSGQRLKLEPSSTTLELANSGDTPSYYLFNDIGIWSITDLANADMLLQAQGRLSFIELIGLTPEQIPQVESILANFSVNNSALTNASPTNSTLTPTARLVATQEQDFDALSEAFFFNLAALALLGYIVAAFLSFNAIKLSIAGRKKLLKQLSILGCTPQAIRSAIIIEFTLMSFITALFGSLAGFVIANALVLDINRTLMGLYKLDQALTIGWQWQTLALGFTINIATLALMLLTQKSTFAHTGNKVFYVALGMVITPLCYLYFNAQSELDALLFCFFILLFFVLITPQCLGRLLRFNNPFVHPLWQWLYADSQSQLKELRLAIVAILVALGSAIGMQIMVKSFSHTLNAHLEKQLSADVYLHVDKYDPTLRARLSADANIKRVGIYMAADGYLNKMPTKLASFGQGEAAFAHINLTSGEAVNAAHFANNGCIANEQASIKHGYRLGELVEFKQNNAIFTCRISAFAYDYGNTALSLMTQEQTLTASPLHWQVYGLSLSLNPQTPVLQLTERLINDYQIEGATITENKRFKEIANGLFNDTFKVTKVLNGFILAIALVSLCISLLSLSAQHAKQLAVLHSLGVDAAQLQTLKLVQTSLLVGFTCLFAIPLGFALGFALLKFVMPIAFGWTIHFNLDLPALFTTCLLLLITAVLCAYLPIKKLTARLHAKGRD